MRIALFTDSFLPGIGGTETVVDKLALGLMKDHEVMVFAPKFRRPFDDGVKPYPIVRAPSITLTKNESWALPGINRRIKKALDAFKPDVIHTHTLGMMAGYANKYGRKNNIPVVCTVHTKFKNCFKDVLHIGLLVNIVLKWIIRRANGADRVTTVSNCMIDELKSYGLKKQVTVIRNGSDIIKFEGEKTESKKFTMIFVGMVTKFKNIGFSLKALAELKKTHPDFTFNIIGAGPHVNYFKRQAKKLGLKDNVNMVGPIFDRGKINEYYRNSDLFLFTSTGDSDGLVVVEAASNGVPSLVIEDTGTAERIKDGENGFVAENDYVKVAEKIAMVMDDRKMLLEVGKRAHEISHDWKKIFAEYQAVYQEEVQKIGQENQEQIEEIQVNVV